MNHDLVTTPGLSLLERDAMIQTGLSATRTTKAVGIFLSALALAMPAAFGDDDMAPPETNWPICLYQPPSFRLNSGAVKTDTPAATNKVAPVADILTWVPPDTNRIRAVLIIVNNAQSKGFGEQTAVRDVAKKYGMGIIYLRNGRPLPTDKPGASRSVALEDDLDNVQPIMDYVAEKTGVVEFRHAPWITYGQSSRGRFPFFMAWKYPKRTIATIDHHAETPTWPHAEWAKFDGETIMHVNLNGEVEWGGTFAIHVRPSLLNYRNKTSWLPHQAVARGIGHTDYNRVGADSGDKTTQREVWDYLALHVEKALSLRLPKEGFPTDGPLKLNNIDPATGYLIETFAIEDILGKPRLNLEEKDGLFVVNPKEPTVNGFAKIPPAADFTPAEGVPVVQVTPGRSPSDWLLTDGMAFAVKADPMVDVSAFSTLRPKPGDEFEIDGKKTAFARITDAQVGRRVKDEPRGVSCKALMRRGGNKLTLLGYTVLEAKEPQTLKVTSLHSLGVRLRIVLNGVPVDHRQIVQLEKGFYPMLFALRMDGVTWEHCEPSLDAATAEEIAEAKGMQASKEKSLAEFEARKAAKRDPMSFIHKYTEVSEAARGRMMWVADEEQAKAWVKLHDLASRQKK